MWSVLFLVASFSACFVAVLSFRYAKLRHIPGPFLASVTDLWCAAQVWQGKGYLELTRELHAQYGPVVRLGPSRISFSQAAAVPAIYGTAQVFPKAASYDPLIVMANGEPIKSLMSIRDEKRMAEIKRHISTGFSVSSWLQQESQIDANLMALVARLKAMPDKSIRLDEWIRFWVYDTLTTLAFSENRGYIAHGADVDEMFPASKVRLEHWRRWSFVPSLEALIFKNPIARRFRAPTNVFAQLAIRQIRSRQTGDKQATGNDILGRFLAASQQAPDIISLRDVIALTISTIHAGFATTANMSSLMIANVLKDPSKHERLEREIRTASLPVPAAFNHLDQLPYLDAVMRETMRLFPNPNVNERTVTPHGCFIGDVWIPGGSDVSVAGALVARDPTVFGADADAFRPERWLDADSLRFREMDRASFGFSYGRRVCIGQHLARIEMKKVVAAIIACFEITLEWPPAPGSVALDVRLQQRVEK